MTSGSESIAPSEIPLAPFFDMKAEIPPEPVDATAQADDDDNDDKKSQNSSSSKGVGRSRPLVETFTSKLLVKIMKQKLMKQL